MKIKIDRKFVPLLATIVLFILSYAFGYLEYKGMRNPQAFANLFIDKSYLLIAAIGETFVILSGGIDLSAGAIIALVSTASAYLMEKQGFYPEWVIPWMLLMGTLLGLAMGCLIHYFKVQPFIATLAGMFFARGMCFFISLDAIPISDPFYRAWSMARIPIPFLGKTHISINVVISLVMLLIAMFILHRTRFGRTVYAIGGNEHSARLMGLQVGRTKILIYGLAGFCSALAGVAYSVALLSGHGLYASGLELDVIASVVIGGTLLTGGVGYVFGTLFGVLINGLIQNLIMFNGQLSSWWTRIAIGALTLIFIGVQSAFVTTKRRQIAVRAARKNGNGTAAAPTQQTES